MATELDERIESENSSCSTLTYTTPTLRASEAGEVEDIGEQKGVPMRMRASESVVEDEIECDSRGGFGERDIRRGQDSNGRKSLFKESASVDDLCEEICQFRVLGLRERGRESGGREGGRVGGDLAGAILVSGDLDVLGGGNEGVDDGSEEFHCQDGELRRRRSLVQWGGPKDESFVV
ncbi:hypothetical protein CPB86DRAFT_794050 [Serendipita vermifera]|nr:hypothetical protein CPB86DRAFT_794050 [Serendipita vermifera]